MIWFLVGLVVGLVLGTITTARHLRKPQPVAPATERQLAYIDRLEGETGEHADCTGYNVDQASTYIDRLLKVRAEDEAGDEDD